jgi:hypothetical protein
LHELTRIIVQHADTGHKSTHISTKALHPGSPPLHSMRTIAEKSLHHDRPPPCRIHCAATAKRHHLLLHVRSILPLTPRRARQQACETAAPHLMPMSLLLPRSMTTPHHCPSPLQPTESRPKPVGIYVPDPNRPKASTRHPRLRLHPWILQRPSMLRLPLSHQLLHPQAPSSSALQKTTHTQHLLGSTPPSASARWTLCRPKNQPILHHQ